MPSKAAQKVVVTERWSQTRGARKPRASSSSLAAGGSLSLCITLLRAECLFTPSCKPPPREGSLALRL